MNVESKATMLTDEKSTCLADFLPSATCIDECGLLRRASTATLTLCQVMALAPVLAQAQWQTPVQVRLRPGKAWSWQSAELPVCQYDGKLHFAQSMKHSLEMRIS